MWAIVTRWVAQGATWIAAAAAGKQLLAAVLLAAVVAVPSCSTGCVMGSAGKRLEYYRGYRAGRASRGWFSRESATPAPTPEHMDHAE